MTAGVQHVERPVPVLDDGAHGHGRVRVGPEPRVVSGCVLVHLGSRSPATGLPSVLVMGATTAERTEGRLVRVNQVIRDVRV